MVDVTLPAGHAALLNVRLEPLNTLWWRALPPHRSGPLDGYKVYDPFQFFPAITSSSDTCTRLIENSQSGFQYAIHILWTFGRSPHEDVSGQILDWQKTQCSLHQQCHDFLHCIERLCLDDTHFRFPELQSDRRNHNEIRWYITPGKKTNENQTNADLQYQYEV